MAAASRLRNLSGHFSTGCIRRQLRVSVTRMASSSAGVQSLFTEVEGHKIHYEKSGHGDHPLVLIPGALGCSRTDLAPQIEKLNPDVFTVIAWDPPGYGKSRPPNRDWPKRFFQRDASYCAKFMETLGYEKYSAGGWSDGGIMAMILAATNPDRMKKLVLWGANAYVTAEEIKIYESIRNIDKWSDRMKKPFIDVYGEDYFREEWSKWIDAITVYFMEHKGNICMDDLSNITCPTLIVHGAKDPIVPQFHPKHLNENIKGSRYINMPEGKHNLHLRYPDEFNKMVEDFLTE